MTDSANQDYILGTERAELFRLGLQHQVWAQEARRGWKAAGFRSGQTLLDLGCGPGFCTQDLAYITGGQGRVIAVDQSPGFIEFARTVNQTHALNIDFLQSSFDDMALEDESLDGAYCRWALAWVPNPEEVFAKVVKALRPGACFVVHEYLDWKTFQTEPHWPELTHAISMALKSFRDGDGDIDVGRRLPTMIESLGLDLASVRPMSKLAQPNLLDWEWPGSFIKVYFPKLVAAGLLDEHVVELAVQQWDELTQTPGAMCFCPQMVEVTARK